MIATQTITFPANGKMTVDIPKGFSREQPVILTFTQHKPEKKFMIAEEEKTNINRIAERLKVEMADVLEMQCCHPKDVGL
ncbi:MAG: hypothetical protein FWD47_15455 [Treponema sp.]|nr:hypothetical protein [Treponema sp.]